MTEEEIAQVKKALRSEIKLLRDSASAVEREAADALIRRRVLELAAYRKADVVLSYLSFGSEVDTRGIIEAAWKDGKTVALPRCAGARKMRWFRVENFNGLECSAHGVHEPRIDPALELLPAECPNAVAIVPALSFDGEGYRLGYGGGYYDTFLAAFSGASIGLCRRAQLSRDPLPRACHDHPVDIIATE